MNVQFLRDMKRSPLMIQNIRIISVIAINGTLSRRRLVQVRPSEDSSAGNPNLVNNVFWTDSVFELV